MAHVKMNVSLPIDPVGAAVIEMVSPTATVKGMARIAHSVCGGSSRASYGRWGTVMVHGETMLLPAPTVEVTWT